MRRVLVLANQTAIGRALLSRLAELSAAESDLHVSVLVPATQPKDEPLDDLGKPAFADYARRVASVRLSETLEAIKGLGIRADGQVGPADPLQGAEEALSYATYDSILVSTLPPGLSRWINMDLPHRLERKFSLPVEHVIGSEKAREAAKTKRSSAWVLLVEDQPADVALTNLAFDAIDVDITLSVTENGQAALDFLRTTGLGTIDLILLDLNMPVLDGHQFLQRLDEDLGIENFNVVVLTTSTSDSDRQRSHELGAAAYVVKEPDFDHFKSTLESLVLEVAKG